MQKKKKGRTVTILTSSTDGFNVAQLQKNKQTRNALRSCPVARHGRQIYLKRDNKEIKAL